MHSFECLKTCSTFWRYIKNILTQLILVFYLTYLTMRLIYTIIILCNFFKMQWLNIFFNASVEEKMYLFNDYSRKLLQRFINNFINFRRFIQIDFINNFYYFATCHCLVIICRWKINKFFDVVHKNNWWKWEINFKYDFNFVLRRCSNVFARLQ